MNQSKTQDKILHQISANASLHLAHRIGRWKIDSFLELPSEWATNERFLPAGTSEYPGKIDWSIAPHMVEICDCGHPDSGIDHVTCMKSTQSLFTTTVESVIGWSIKHKLHNILNIISSKGIAKIRSSSAIDVMIDNSGLAEFVKPISERMKRKTADNTFYKELHGGRRLMMTSWFSIGDAKSLTWSFIFEDELDEASLELKGQGDPQKIFEGRGKTVRNLMIYRGGTPTLTTARTYRNFLEGDQRFYHNVCPYCEELQPFVLLFGAEGPVTGSDYGLTARTEHKNKVEQIIPESVEYICKNQKCKHHKIGHGIKEHKKNWMMSPENGALWIPSATPKDPRHRSYHISNMMSPIMFFTWTKCMQEFLETDFGQDIPRYKNFRIDNLGWPWENRLQVVKWRDIYDKSDNYPLGIVPHGGLIVTAGIDVQKTWLELVSIAWGKWPEYWVIDHQKFIGPTENKNNKVWTDMKEYVRTKKYEMDNGKQLVISLSGIDSAFNPKEKLDPRNNTVSTEHTVYEVVASMKPKAIALRGDDNLKDAIIKEQRIRKAGPLNMRYDLAVSTLKDELYAVFDLDFCHIHLTKKLGENFFRGIFSEVYAETKSGKWEWKKVFERNEPLDCININRGVIEALNYPTLTEEAFDDLYNRLYKE